MSTVEHPEGDEPAERADMVPAETAEPAVAAEIAADAPDEPEAASTDPGSAPDPDEAPDPREASEISIDRTTVRRAPRFGRFGTMGALLGVLVAAVQTRLAHPDTIAAAGGPWASNTWGFFWLMCLIFVPIGVLAMCGLALLLDRRSRRVKRGSRADS